jgi:hypothetical protein
MQGSLHVTTRNLLGLDLSDPRLAAVDAALGELEAQLAGLVALEADRRRSLARMGDRSEAFCRQALRVLEQNPQIVPPSLGLAEAQADLDAVDRLRPRLMRLQRLTRLAQDSDTLLGSGVMACALRGYALLKVAGAEQGLEGLRQELGSRFARPARAPAAPVPPRSTEPA